MAHKNTQKQNETTSAPIWLTLLTRALTPSLRRAYAKPEEEKRSRRDEEDEEEAEAEGGGEKKRPHRSTVPQLHPPNSTNPPRSTHTHSVPPSTIDLAYADPYAELTRACARRCSARKLSKIFVQNPIVPPIVCRLSHVFHNAKRIVALCARSSPETDQDSGPE